VFQGVETALPAARIAWKFDKWLPIRGKCGRAGFFLLARAKADGNKFIQDAIKRGAVAIASEELAPGRIPAGVVWIQVQEGRKALAITAANFLGIPRTRCNSLR